MTAHDPPEKTSPTEVTSSASLWRHHDFRQLWMGDTVSVFGVQFVSFAMPLIAVQLLHADAFEMGVLSTLESLAFLLIALPAGAWVDRMRKKHVLISGDVLRALVLLSIPAAWLLGALSFVHLCIVAALVGIITVFFDVANQSYLPEIVTGDRIAEGNGKLQASQQTANVIGPSAAAGLVALIGSPLTVGITSVCMGLSSLFVSRIRHREQAPSPTSRQPLLKEIRAGLAFVFSHSLLVRIVACTGTSNFSSSAIFALSTLYILRTLDQPQAVLGLVLSISAAGGLLGALAAPALQRIVGEGRTISLSALAGGLSFPQSAVGIGPATGADSDGRRISALCVGRRLQHRSGEFSSAAVSQTSARANERIDPIPRLWSDAHRGLPWRSVRAFNRHRGDPVGLRRTGYCGVFAGASLTTDRDENFAGRAQSARRRHARQRRA